MMSVRDVRSVRAKLVPTGPVWAGPESNEPNGGITFSLLTRFLSCRERFRLRVVEGLKPADRFNHRIEYGNMWHVCEEALAKGNDPTRGNKADRSVPLWAADLNEYVEELSRKYPLNRPEIQHWWMVCRTQFPIYVRYWSDHPDVRDRTPLLQEQIFDVPYRLPSGRTVRLRGKWDSVDLVGRGRDARIYLQENKTKGDIDEEQLRRQLTFDLQTMMYLVALGEMKDLVGPPLSKVVPDLTAPIAGVRYNVVRRPLSGGEGNIVRHKATKNKPEESPAAFYDRLRGVIDGTGEKSNGERYAGPPYWFMRWKVEVTPADVAKFRRECLDPILEQLCRWWDWVSKSSNPFDSEDVAIHWRHPFGSVNWLDEGGASDVDEYLATGSEVGLVRGANLFEEL